MAQSAKAKREQAERVQSQLGGHSPFNPKDYVAREFYSMEELQRAIRNKTIVCCWGVEEWLKFDKFTMRLKVNGHHLTGYVYIMVNSADLFNIYYTDFNNMIKFYDEDVFIDQLITVIDKRIEYIPEI